jgi:hypothetical protein
LGLGELVRGDGTEPDMTNEALLLEFDEHLQMPGHGSGLGRGKTAHAEVDNIKGFEAEVAQVIVDALYQVFTRTVLNPGAVVPTAGADLGDEGDLIFVALMSFGSLVFAASLS